MRILHVVSSLNVGGAERFVIDLAAQQQTQNNVAILSMSNAGEVLQEEALDKGLDVFCIPNTGALSQMLSIRKLTQNYDIVHVHSSFALLRVMICTRLLNNRTKLIYTRHNERVHDSLKWKLTYWLAKQCVARFVFVSSQSMQKYTARYPELKMRCVTVLNGVVPLTRNSVTKKGFHIGHVGRFVPLKSQHLLVEAVAKLPKEMQQKLTLHFYGTGPELKNVKAMATNSNGLFDAQFHGHQADRIKIYSSFDLLVVTSETEGLSLTIIEALACKMPVLASSVGGNPELVSHQINGYLHEYGDTQTLADQIQLLINEPELVARLGNTGFQKYEAQFSIETCASKYIDVYNNALN